MERSILETRIEQKAVARFEKDWKSFVEFGNSNNIARRLYIKNTSINGKGLGDNVEPDVLKNNLPLFNTGDNYALFNNRSTVIDKYRQLTNFEEIKNKIVAEYIKEETENLLNKIDTLKDFFETALNN